MAKKQAKKPSSRRGFILWILAALLLVLLILGVVGVYAYRTYVSGCVENGRCPHIERSRILQRISMESPVYYRDGKTKIGVFFEGEHRQYVKFADLPRDYVNAIVAAEDQRFWDHPGFDVLGFSRAMVGNIKARKLIGGGSTITSQTAKNIYDRQGRTLGPKLIEVLNAFRLEAYYSKEEILEFYANQFHVYGNGRGIGIAARYFFDKDVRDLDTLESAYLAGVVKAPFRYNPFTGTTEEARSRAREKAELRTTYVLNRMADEGYITPARARELIPLDIPFRKGQWRYEQNVVLDYVFDQLQQEPYASLFAVAGIDNPATAGVQIITTLDQDAQEAALYGLRHNLTEVGTQLEGLDITSFLREETQELRPIREDEVTLHRFFEGRITAVLKEGEGAPGLEIDLGGPLARVDKQGLLRVADFLKKAEAKAIWAGATGKDVGPLLEEFRPGQAVTVSVREPGHAETLPLVDLEATTTLQGAVVVLDRGEIRAMVGGSDNRNFNRASSAVRQLGSTFKTLTYAAAITLGWSPLDVLDNSRQGFAFQDQAFYWPRADHTPKHEAMSMAWVADSSENVATISLLYHLLDRLTEEQVIDLAHKMDMAPREGEPDDVFLERIRDTYGILPTEEGLREGIYREVRDQALPDLVFSGLIQSETDPVRWLPWGRLFGVERERIGKNKGKGLTAEEKAARLDYLSTSFLSLEEKAPRAMEVARQYLAGQGEGTGLYVVERGGEKWITWSEGKASPGWVAVTSPGDLRAALAPPAPVLDPPEEGEAPAAPDAEDSAYEHPGQGGQDSAERDREHLPRRKKLGARLLERVDETQPRGEVVGRESAPMARLRERVAKLSEASGHTLEERLLVEGVATPAVLTRLRENVESRFTELSQVPRYDIRRLVRDPDFRVLLGMRYTLALAREAGVKSPMKPVLSLPLGSNDITLLESALMYQTFIEGRVYTFRDPAPGEGFAPAEACAISTIIGPDGTVLWRAKPGWRQVMSPTQASSVARLLRGVVERGTGRTAEGAVELSSPDPERQKEISAFRAAMPVMGKTGTTNDYVNVAFVGFLPTIPPGLPVPVQAIPWGSALTVASYVGYDDNRPMKRGAIRITGALGALPVWVDTARGIVRSQDLSRVVDLADLAFQGGKVLPMTWPDGMEAVLVNEGDGLALPVVPPPPEDSSGAAPTTSQAVVEPGAGADPPPGEGAEVVVGVDPPAEKTTVEAAPHALPAGAAPRVLPPAPAGAVYYDAFVPLDLGTSASGYAPFESILRGEPEEHTD